MPLLHTEVTEGECAHLYLGFGQLLLLFFIFIFLSFLFACFLTTSLNKLKLGHLGSSRRSTTKAIGYTFEHGKESEHNFAVIETDFSHVLVLKMACRFQQENFNVIKIS